MPQQPQWLMNFLFPKKAQCSLFEILAIQPIFILVNKAFAIGSYVANDHLLTHVKKLVEGIRFIGLTIANSKDMYKIIVKQNAVNSGTLRQ